MSAKPDYVVSTLTRPNGTGAATGGFVINLTSSTTPMALSQPKDPTLAQYSFFVSRRREDGRERFRLHMGYFETQAAAEEMLAVVREVYPSAWAGEAPGKKLRANNPAAAPAAAAPAATPPARAAAPAPTPAPPRAVAPPPVAVMPAAAPPAPVAVMPAAAPPPPPAAVMPAAAPPPVAAQPEPHPFASTPPPVPTPEFEAPFELSDDAPDFRPIDVPVVHPPISQPEAKTVARTVVSPPPVAAKPVAPKAPAKPVAAKPAVPAKAAAPVKAAAPKPAPARPVAAKAQPAKPPAVAPKIAAKVSAPALTAPAPRPAAPAAPPPQAAAPVAPPVAAVAAPEPTVQMPAPIMPAAPALSNVRQVIEELDDLSDTQTIRLLERHSPFREGSSDANVDEAIRVIKPEDAQSMLAIKNEVKRNAPVLFAVQLDWSVTAFDMAKVPPLAIFNAYTLYTTEANRDGRTWFGLRLGFFSDAVSAKQVAYYVRSDFKAVSVVPVTTIEKERANDINAARSGIYRAANIKEGPAPTPASMAASNASGQFKLLDDDMPEHIAQDVDGETSPRFGKSAALAPAAPAITVKPAPAPAPAPEPAAKASNKRKPGAKGMRRDAHAHVDEETLDQTLEILGASTLEIQNDRSGDTGVRHLRVKIDKKGSKFASLIDRLSGKK